MKKLTTEDVNRLMNKSKNGRVAIAKTFISIDDFAFYGRTGLESVTIGNSVKSIGEDSFLWCENLTSVTITNPNTKIALSAFYGCTALKRVTIPEELRKLAPWVFPQFKITLLLTA